MLRDNYYGMCPGKIPGGELFTDWRLADTREHYIMYINNINGDNHEYRHFLQKNGVKLMENEHQQIYMKGRCKLDNCGLGTSKGSIIDKCGNKEKELSCARTILGYGFPIIHNYPTRMDPRLFSEESEKYNKFVLKYKN